MRRLTKGLIAGGFAVAMVGGLAACEEPPKSESRKTENKARLGNYDRLVKSQPAHTGPYSPTRETKNFWVDTWMHDKSKLSYVYIQNANGQYGYYVLKGLPVTYCVSLVPPEVDHRINLGSDGSAGVTIPGPSIDGTYSSSSNCNSYYGKDAVTGAYMEFSVGQNQSYQLFDQPIDLPQYENAKPMGPSTIDAAKKIK
jgi:hypothetical protein